ncbi:BURP domain-containing protein 3 [Acorus gramineus]|uniref:BURP domain-containing protein 3 n=1 Tax=Acorus gramineus TaxID=55184 RepID=A0AAV8ZVF6_ACOGR|nr:BURP domain-containing protein 3 [Acorus gramineus]
MHIRFTKATTEAFLPLKEAKSILFSTTDLPNTLFRFCIKPKSKLALLMQETFQLCETPPKSEEKHCATSLESMKKNSSYKWYTVMGTAKEVSDAKATTLNCHPLTYAYLTYYCHSIVGTRTYVVPFVGDDETKAEVVAVCHTDTSEWDPKHVAFQMQHVKPGTVQICHTLAADTIVWMTI